MAIQFEPKEDCAGFCGDKNRFTCTALNEMLCVKTGRCSFYISRERAREKQKQAHKRAVRKGYYLCGSNYVPKT